MLVKSFSWSFGWSLFFILREIKIYFMRYQLLFDNFVSMVEDSIPQNTKLSAVLADILQIEKEAVYRRLRMEVPFTFCEIATVAQALGLSVDNMIGAIPTKSRPLMMTLIEYIDPDEIDYIMVENYANLARQIKNMTDSETGVSCSSLPNSLYIKYENINKFYFFKWQYLYANAGQVKPFSDVKVTERMRKMQKQLYDSLRGIKHTNYIWDRLVFYSIVEDIKHFASIYLITPEEVAELKSELNSLLMEMEVMAANGCHPDTGTSINFYLSNIYFETDYTYFQASNLKLCMLKAFSLNAAATQDEKTFEKVINWMRSLKRVSTLISESGEKQRVMFFEKQKEIIGML